MLRSFLLIFAVAVVTVTLTVALRAALLGPHRASGAALLNGERP